MNLGAVLRRTAIFTNTGRCLGKHVSYWWSLGKGLTEAEFAMNQSEINRRTNQNNYCRVALASTKPVETSLSLGKSRWAHENIPFQNVLTNLTCIRHTVFSTNQKATLNRHLFHIIQNASGLNHHKNKFYTRNKIDFSMFKNFED